jgi:hypothetical protein
MVCQTADIVACRTEKLALDSGFAATRLAGDLDGDGRTDFGSISGAPGGNANLLRIALAKADGTYRVLPEQPWARFYAMHVVDVDGNGLPDIALADIDDADLNTLSVALGHGDGRFDRPVRFPAVGDFSVEGSTDVNGDGKQDLLSLTGGRVAVALGGTTTPRRVPESYLLTEDCSSICQLQFTGDIDHDGFGDVVVSTGEVLLGAKDGTFRQGPVLGASAIQYASSALRPAVDLTGDAELDVPRIADGAFSIHPGKGDGTFGAPTKVDIAPYAITDGFFADFDGDGRPDLIAKDESAGILAIRLSDGKGGFAAPSFYQPSASFSIEGDLAPSGHDLLLNFGGELSRFPASCHR